MPFNPGLLVQKFFKGVTFPTDTQTLIAQARSEDVDPHVHRILEQLPVREFATRDEVTVTIAQLGVPA